MASHIPFVNTEDDCRRFKDYYSDSVSIRISLDAIDAIKQHLPEKVQLWLDPSVDGYHHLLISSSRKSKTVMTPWEKLIDKFEENEVMSDVDFLKNPDQGKLKEFVKSALELCLKYDPSWITVPQLPLLNDLSRNRINRDLAKTTNEWKLTSAFKGKLVLPIIFTNQQQYKGKTERNKRKAVIKNCYESSGANIIWVVDSSLSDLKGSGAFRNRFSNLIEFHKDLIKWCSGNASIVAGPYWGINVVLWARELCDYPAIGPGGSYKYHIPGPFSLHRGSARVVIPPLRRSVSVDPSLRGWLRDVLGRLDPKDCAYQKILKIIENFDMYFVNLNMARDQTAKFYKEWLNEIEAIPAAGRPLALYQMLSSAFVFGKKMPKLSKSEGYGGDASMVAQQLMLNCF